MINVFLVGSILFWPDIKENQKKKRLKWVNQNLPKGQKNVHMDVIMLAFTYICTQWWLPKVRDVGY
jgi:hypothetical protein